MSVLLTDGDQRSSLAVVRSLGAAGVSVTVGHSEPHSLAGRSRYCRATLRYPSPWTEPRRFQQFLAEEVRRGGYELLLPMTDVTTRLVAEQHDALAAHVRVPLPDLATVERAQNKRTLLALAEELGIAYPQTYAVSSAAELEALAPRLRYPVVLKPAFSRRLVGDRWETGPVEYARTPEDLVRRYRAAAARILEPLVQERIEGDGLGVFLLLWEGELRAAFCHRRLREKPPWGGVSVLRESVAPDAELIAASRRLLERLGWHGVAMVEFKRDRRDGRAKLMEVNGRFWGSLQLAVDAGLDFPLLLYRLATGQAAPAQLDYRAGVKSRWLLGDLDHLLTVFRHTGSSNGHAPMKFSRWRTTVDFLKFFQREMHYEVFRFSDPGPGWFECRTWLREALRAWRG